MKPSQSRRYDFALASYWPRAIGLGLGFLVLLPVLVEYNPWWALIGPSFQGLIWPHLAFRWRHPSGDSERAEWRNQLADHFMAGAWLPLIGFNVLPSALMVAFLGMNSMIAGGPRHFLRGMLAHAAGTVVGLLVFGVRWHPETTMVQVLSCLPLLLHPIWVSYMASRASSKLRRQRQDLTYMSQHDALSGLYNRGYWEEAVRTEFAKFQRSGDVATLVLADLDHFKRVNDQLGHGAGDEVLRGFAERLRTNLRAVDTPGRYGGEEFGILLPSTSPGDAGEIMQRLQASLHSQPLLPQRTVTASFGVAALTPDLQSHEAWMRLADQMLYRAKDRGRDCVVVAGEASHSPPLPTEHQRRRKELPAAMRVLRALNLGDIGAALFDSSDRLVWANEVFIALFAVQQRPCTFRDIMRHCHRHQVGPLIETEDIDTWLQAADAKRRSQLRRSFTIDLLDGRYFRVDEISLDDGWLVDFFSPASAAELRAIEQRSQAGGAAVPQ